jgi:hypothetical protein
MTDTRQAERKSIIFDAFKSNGNRIIQDCEDALTGWVPQHAAVKSSLSTRARQLSQRRINRAQEPVDLSAQDRPMDRESWVGEHAHDDEDDEEEAYGTRGRENERNHRSTETEA